MGLFSKKKTDNETYDFEDYSTLTLPFVTDEVIKQEAEESSAPAVEKTPEPERSETSAAETLPLYPGGVSPLDALKKRMNVEISQPVTPEVSAVAEKPLDAEEPAPDKEEPTSLLKKCLPYIYDEEGISQADRKPDYVLESVDDIIRSAEERASSRIAERYKLTDKNGKRIPLKAEPAPAETPAAKETPAARPEVKITKSSLSQDAEVLFDDFSGKRTVVTPTESVTTPYSKLTELQTGISSTDTASTLVMPAVKPQKTDTMEDIVSHTRPVNIKDAPAIKPQKPIAVTVNSDDLLPEPTDEYRSADDAKRIGLLLRRNRRSAFLRLVLTLLCTIASAVFVLIIPEAGFSPTSLVPFTVKTALLAASILLNIGIFSSFKGMFTKNTSAAAPVTLAVTLTVAYTVFGLIAGRYSADLTLLTLVSLSAYDLFSYRRETARLNSFKLVTTKAEKKAVALIDDQKTASSMARSSIEGEVLAVGTRRAGVLTDFMKFSYADAPFGGFLGTLLTVFAVLALAAAVIIGVSHRSFESALQAAALLLSIFAMPSYSVAEFLPICGLSKKLYSKRAMLCGKYSASKIEQANAVVISSSELFPDGSIELFNMKPLGASNIDRTLSAAARVAEAVGSPLVSVFKTFINGGFEQTADTCKYEDNLGISGWVGDEHYFIGNRTLMEAHGIRVPSLEVDRKILHRGYFPVYVAVGQRALALLIVKYRPNLNVKNNLIRLANAGMTLLIDNCDCNITAAMLSDYYGIYEDSIKVMDHKGVHNYKNAVNYTEFMSAHAAYIGSSNGFFAIINGALRLGILSKLLYTVHIVLAALAATVFLLAALDGGMMLMSVTACLLLELIALAVTLTVYYIARR